MRLCTMFIGSREILTVISNRTASLLFFFFLIKFKVIFSILQSYKTVFEQNLYKFGIFILMIPQFMKIHIQVYGKKHKTEKHYTD